ncbi:hypothetical protein AJ80_06193 [Polytolypa hystricis UAMH7299]|uniref:DASH complex subunit DAD2 n=1 Tax=Polytolypa hystricis (strain UAMH7299) TaxID=1447883 RepID=A0A2B7XXY3_POLH7|nr:hypothetical protein AJ80_06193 [Polytolypa hystricis UAMH7299]
MAQPPRHTTILPSSGAAASLRQSNVYGNTSQQSSALAARIAAKRLELENLKQLRDISDSLAAQMQTLEAKLETLKDGTEAVACVMANWGSVLSAIRMASMQAAQSTGNGAGHQARTQDSEPPLPATLVRIPAELSDSRRQNEAGTG